jgi:hypothetical protein
MLGNAFSPPFHVKFLARTFRGVRNDFHREKRAISGPEIAWMWKDASEEPDPDSAGLNRSFGIYAQGDWSWNSYRAIWGV